MKIMSWKKFGIGLRKFEETSSKLKKYEKIFRSFLGNYKENVKEIWNIWGEIKKKKSSTLKKIYGKCEESFKENV